MIESYIGRGDEYGVDLRVSTRWPMFAVTHTTTIAGKKKVPQIGHTSNTLIIYLAYIQICTIQTLSTVLQKGSEARDGEAGRSIPRRQRSPARNAGKM